MGKHISAKVKSTLKIMEKFWTFRTAHAVRAHYLDQYSSHPAFTGGNVYTSISRVFFPAQFLLPWNRVKLTEALGVNGHLQCRITAPTRRLTMAWLWGSKEAVPGQVRLEAGGVLPARHLSTARNYTEEAWAASRMWQLGWPHCTPRHRSHGHLAGALQKDPACSMAGKTAAAHTPWLADERVNTWEWCKQAGWLTGTVTFL